jgi:starch synthase
MAKKPTGSKPTGSKRDAARRGASKHTAPKSATTPRPPLPPGEVQVAAAGSRASVPDQGESPKADAPESKVLESETFPPALSARAPLKTASAAQPPTDPVPAPAAAHPPGGSAAGGETASEPEPKTEPKIEPKTEQATLPTRSSTPAEAPSLPPTRPRPTRDPEPASKPAPTSLPEPFPELIPEPEKPSAPSPEPEPEYEQPPEPEPIHAPARPPPAPPRPLHRADHPGDGPVAKVGGLADVVFGLTRELAIRGNHVETILPKYDNLRYDHIFELHPVYEDLWVPWYDGAIHCTVYFGFVHGRKCFFIEPHSQDNFFNRGSIYGFPDDVMRYAFFSRAAMEFLFKAGKHPDVIHCHDWQTALWCRCSSTRSTSASG